MLATLALLGESPDLSEWNMLSDGSGDARYRNMLNFRLVEKECATKNVDVAVRSGQ